MKQDLTISEMFEMQRALWELHRNEWSPLTPEYGKNSILWMVEEIGEVIAIIKKKGPENITGDPVVRAAFLEEVSDVMMYLNDALLRYGVTAEEISVAYTQKYNRNMKRDFRGDNEKFLSGENSPTMATSPHGSVFQEPEEEND